jgi:hypothetical protein
MITSPRHQSSVSTTPPSKDPPFRPLKPIAEVLKECRPNDREEQLKADLGLLDKFRISTAVNWQELSDASKKNLQANGLPEAVINDLNKAVRIGLLLPAFKYADECSFLRDEPFWSAEPAKAVVQFAEAVDSNWVLTRRDCDVLCNSYQKMCEWSLKLALERWNTLRDDTFIKARNHTVHIHRFDERGHPFSHSFKVRYPVTHSLFSLKELVVVQVPAFRPKHVPAKYTFNRLNDCAITTTGGKTMPGDHIDCAEFFAHARDMDAYLLELWSFFKNTDMTKTADLPDIIPK